MMKFKEILLMVLTLVVCTSEKPNNPTKRISIIDPLDKYRIQYRSTNNEFDRKVHEAYLNSQEIKEQ